MQFRAAIPPNVNAGAIVRVNAHNVPLNVRVPKHATQGDFMVFEISKTELADASKLVIDATLAPSIDSPLMKSSRSMSNLQSGSSNNNRFQMPWFCNEFGMALGMAALIALSIICGFLFGILYVTQPLGPNGELPPAVLPSSLISKARQGGRTIMHLQPINIHRD